MSKVLAGYLFLVAVNLLPASAIAASAVAVDQAAHKLGYCHSKPSLEEAKQCAVLNCSKSGGRNCQVTATGTKGGYSAIAAGNGQLGVFLSSYDDENMVSFYALNDCIQKVTGCNSMVEQCPETACKIIAKWHEPETAEPAQSTNRPPNKAPDQAAGASSSVNPKAQALLKQANELFRAKSFGEALVAYTQAIDADPNYAAAWDGRGATYAITGSYDAARRNYDTAISLKPKNGHAYFNRALLNRKTGQEQAYLADLKMAAQLGNEKARSLLGKSAEQAKSANSPAGLNNAGGQGQTPNAPGEPAKTGSAQPGKVRNGNAVEPLSNGLLLTMERNEVRRKFGDAPRRGGFASCDMAYGNFSVDMCYGPHISRAYINGRGLTLNSGIGVGSSKADVARVFGNPYGLTSGQYVLDFKYDGERVSRIKIEPADGDFKPYAASAASTHPLKRDNASAGGSNSDIVGTWHGTATTVGTIVIRADGTYDYNGSPGGRWKASGDSIVFDGTLAAWGGGRATLKGGNLEFSWKSAEGWNQWFSFAK